MKVFISYSKNSVPQKFHNFYHKFIVYLQSNYSLEKNVLINFLTKRKHDMTTGSRTEKHIINILTKNRLNRDILRTLAHEWIHEYERSILKMGKGPDIGGPNENLANAISGEIIKKFEKKYPELTHLMYESVS